MELNLEIPINSVSFGQVSVNILFELYKIGARVRIFPIGNNLDFSTFDKFDSKFQAWIVDGVNSALVGYNSKIPVFKLWHISSSQNKVADSQFLFTFHETDGLTPTEVNILNNQKAVIVSSPYNKEVFEKSGAKNVHYIPLGFDANHFKRLEKRLVPENVISFGLLSKFEHRKRTEKVLRAWAKKYGNNPRYILQVAVTNPFFNAEQNKQVILQALEGKQYHNINFLPFTQKNSDYNSLLNAIDIIIDGSGGECWSLPSFQTACIGKHGVLHNCAGVKAWSEDSGFTLFEPSGKISAVDNIFFTAGTAFNQGNIFDFSVEDLNAALDIAEEKYRKNRVNEKGLEMAKKFTWENTTLEILKVIENGN